MEDNGIGLDDNMIERINNNTLGEGADKRGIGLKNAVTRLNMYYGNEGRVAAKAVSPTGTRIEVTIPYSEKQD